MIPCYSGAFIDFRISADVLDFRKIRRLLPIKPDFIQEKGDSRYDRITDKMIEFQKSVWIYGKELGSEPSLWNEKMIRFINKILENQDGVKLLSEVYEVSLWISVFGSDNHFSFRCIPGIMRAIASLNINMDIEYQLI